ncbi:MAG: hypothetical protein IPO05_17720 [Flavobacteriales bacterium]|nr:hypothetical protein [Flavobacteriales bacterium]
MGSNVANNSPPPSEDDLLGQLRAMMQERTRYEIQCENGVIVEPRTATSLFDFSDAAPIADGYADAMSRMPEILAHLQRRVSPGRWMQAQGVPPQLRRWTSGGADPWTSTRSPTRYVGAACTGGRVLYPCQPETEVLPDSGR